MYVFWYLCICAQGLVEVEVAIIASNDYCYCASTSWVNAGHPLSIAGYARRTRNCQKHPRERKNVPKMYQKRSPQDPKRTPQVLKKDTSFVNEGPDFDGMGTLARTRNC